MMDSSLRMPIVDAAHHHLRARLNGWVLALVLGTAIGVAGIGIAFPRPAMAHSTTITTHHIASETGGPGN